MTHRLPCDLQIRLPLRRLYKAVAHFAMTFFMALPGSAKMGPQASVDEMLVKSFWREKPRIYKKMREEKFIPVNVNTVENAGAVSGTHLLTLQGAALVKRPQKITFSTVTDFTRLKDISDHIKKTKFDEVKKELYILCEAFTYTAEMWMKVEFEKKSEALSQMRFQVIKGTFRGISGVLQTKDIDENLSEMALVAKMDYKKLPFPDFFIHFGLEVVLQKIAGRIRSHVEEVKK